MVEIDVKGSEQVIETVKEKIEELSAEPVQMYRHGGFAGEAGIFGAVVSVTTAVLPKVLELLKPLVSQDRNLKLNVNGLEMTVRDLGEADEVLNLLADRGLLPKVSGHDTTHM